MSHVRDQTLLDQAESLHSSCTYRQEVSLWSRLVFVLYVHLRATLAKLLDDLLKHMDSFLRLFTLVQSDCKLNLGEDELVI